MVMDLPEVQEAVRQIPGVAAATIRWPDPLGPASLRVEFDEGANQQAIGEAIIRTLVDVADVDLATMHLERANVVEQRPRPVFQGLSLERFDDELAVEVHLRVDTTDVRGRSSGVLADRPELRLVAEATVDALHRTQAGPFEVRDVQRLEMGGTEMVVTTVAIHDGHSAALIGAAVVGLDARESTVRATLDAVNRVLSVVAH